MTGFLLVFHSMPGGLTCNVTLHPGEQTHRISRACPKSWTVDVWNDGPQSPATQPPFWVCLFFLLTQAAQSGLDHIEATAHENDRSTNLETFQRNCRSAANMQQPRKKGDSACSFCSPISFLTDFVLLSVLLFIILFVLLPVL